MKTFSIKLFALFLLVTLLHTFAYATTYYSIKGITNPNDLNSWVDKDTTHDINWRYYVDTSGGIHHANSFNDPNDIFILNQGDSLTTEGNGLWKVSGEIRLAAGAILIVSGIDTLQTLKIRLLPGGPGGQINIINNGCIVINDGGFIYNKGILNCISGVIKPMINGESYILETTFGGTTNLNSNIIDVGNGTFFLSDGTLNTGTGIILGNNFFNEGNGILTIGSPDGITNAPTMNGNIQTTIRKYVPSFNNSNRYTFIYNGNMPQVVGDGLPRFPADSSCAGIIIIDNPEGVTLNDSIFVKSYVTNSGNKSTFQINKYGKCIINENINSAISIIGSNNTLFVLEDSATIVVNDSMENRVKGFDFIFTASKFSSKANYEFRGHHTGTFITSPYANTVNKLILEDTAATITLDQNFAVNDSLVINRGNTANSYVSLGNHKLTINGNVRNNITPFKGSYRDTLIINGSGTIADPFVFASNFDTLNRLEVNRTSNAAIYLQSNLTLSGARQGNIPTLKLSNGYINIGNDILTLDSGYIISGTPSASSFISTTDGNSPSTNGGLKIIGDGSKTDTFPLGIYMVTPPSIVSYNPAYLTHSGTLNNFLIRIDTARPNPTVITTPSVNRLWHITRLDSKANEIKVDLTYNNGEQEIGFNTPINVIHLDNTASHTDKKGADNIFNLVGGSQTVTSGIVTFNSFSPFGISSGNIPMPLSDLIFFNAKKQSNNTVLINWKIGNNNSVQYFYIEKSLDGRNFSTISKKSFTQNVYEYNIIDNVLKPNRNYYRLCIVDKNGIRNYSSIIAVINGTSGMEIIGFEFMPEKNRAALNISCATITKLNISVTDILGKSIKMMETSLNPGNNTIELMLEKLSSGMYQINCSSQQLKFYKSFRFLKQ